MILELRSVILAIVYSHVTVHINHFACYIMHKTLTCSRHMYVQTNHTLTYLLGLLFGLITFIVNHTLFHLHQIITTTLSFHSIFQRVSNCSRYCVIYHVLIELYCSLVMPINFRKYAFIQALFSLGMIQLR